MADPQEQRQINTGSDKSKDEKGKGMAQSSVHPIRPGTKDCRCDYRRTCRHNHPPHLRHELREKTDTPVCKSTNQRASESRQGFEDIYQRRDDKARGFKRPRSPMNPSVNAQEDIQEHRQGNSKRQRRESQENMQQHRSMREMPENHNVYAHNQHNLEEQRKREIERQRMDARLRDDQFFPKGKCKKGSDCLFRHIMNRGGSEPMRQSTSHRATESRRQGVEASVFKRAMIPMNRSVNAQENLQVQRHRDNIKRQRREAQESMQEQRQRDNIERQRREAQENMQEQRHRDNIKRHRREAQENLQEQRHRDNIKRHRREAQENLQEQRQRDNIKRQGREDQENQQQQRLVMEMPENHNVEAHNQHNQEEQRKIEIERMRREARLRIDQIRPTALFEGRSLPKDFMEIFGRKDAKGL